MSVFGKAGAFLAGTSGADRVVPPTGFTARLTVFTAAAMAFLAVFALALSLATDRLATRWSEALARTATIRISAPPEQAAQQLTNTLTVLETTPGVAEARPLGNAERMALLEPWFGPDLPLDALRIPELIEVVETEEGVDVAGLRARLAGEAPGAVYDDHTRWREPLVHAAERLRMLGLLSLGLISAATAAMITLAAQAALAANERVIAALRLIGALDTYIARAFVRRFTLRALVGAATGTALGMAAIALLPSADAEGGFLTGLSLTGTSWLLPLAIPPIAAIVAFAATRYAAFRQLRKTT
ncbi:cell division protein FtsX [Aliiruegeria lutimaris]|uniref:Cell division transport system permease protein n=1 Tax=Aliiruegeria lutimaris TaxID=571298 RepID=A0A1G8ZVP2_9RHOB|nr:FtsX-like permease family protein [Aliiruegeria lutimaris]SDK19202.1 cell division transport system permease protein [Aliiruegeria lutimaris]